MEDQNAAHGHHMVTAWQILQHTDVVQAHKAAQEFNGFQETSFTAVNL